MAGSGTMGDSGPTGTIPTAVAGTISRLPGQIALRQGGRALTYAQLGHAVAAAVAALIDLGVTSREIDTVAGTRVRTDITTAAPPVVVIAPIGLEGTVLQLAVLFSGRVCTPLEPTLGPDALLSIIGSTGGPVVCLDPDLLATLGAAGAPCADPSNLQLSVLLDAPAHDLHAPDGHPDDAALLCFTSGTTGTPKGVLVPHSMLIEAARFARTDETDVVAITSPPSFFASMLQTLLAIAVGGTGIYLDLTTNTPAQLHRIAVDHGLDHVTGTTTHLRELAGASIDEPITSLWGIDLGGEPITSADVELFRRSFPAARIRNIYGSAESGRVTSLDVAPGDDLPPPGPLTAGGPSTGRMVAVFDDDDRPASDGETGHIALHRPEPFLGYWRDPARTASRILHTPDGRVWILTGDLGRLDEKGILTVLGRTDDQVKIRGRFVNPRDIDSLLLADPRIRAAITIPFPADAPTHLRTIIVPAAPDPTLTQPALRHSLAQSLPIHSLPRHIILVDRIPTTTRGKPDIAALHRIEPPPPDRPVGADDSAPERTDGTVLEDSLLHSIRELLGIELGSTDDIFAMGADSLMAVELIEMLAEDFGARISPAQLVAHPTAAALAVLLRNGIDDDTHPGLTTLFDNDHPTTAFWILGADESFGPARLARRTAPIRSFCTRVIGTRPHERPLPSIAAIGATNAENIDRVRSATTVIIGYSVGTVIALETACALARRGTPADLLILIDPPPVETVEGFRRSNALPSPLRDPRWFLQLLRKRNTELHHPFDTSDPLELVTRMVNRHTRLLLDHTMSSHDGPTELILSQEFVDAGGTPVTDAGLLRPPAPRSIGGTHHEVLVEPAEVTSLILRLLAEHGLPH